MATRNRLVAAILAVFFGSFGGHKLYLRDTGGFIMFIFLFMFSISVFSVPLTSILGILDALRLVSMTDEEFNRKYNRGIRRPKHSNVDRRRAEQLRRYQHENVRRGYEKPVVRKRRKVVKHNPFKSSGLAKYKEFELDEAIVDFKKGLDINPNDIALHFNLACAYSLTEKKINSFQHLSRAVQLGFNDFERILNHDDLAFLRIQPEFDAFKSSGFTSIGNMAKQSNDSIVKEAEKSNDVLLSQLNRLAELKRRGILSEDEFLLEKKKLMNR